MLLTLNPAFPLSSVVECIWHHEGTIVVRGREHVLPDGRFQIVLNLAAVNPAFPLSSVVECIWHHEGSKIMSEKS
jgi:hypothetical protein